MGCFSVQIQVGKPGSELTETVEALVDTGATFPMIPASMLQRLGIEPDESRLFRIGTGEIVEYMTGDAFFIAEGRRSSGRVVFGPENHYVMGATTLELLQLVVDPVHQRLVGVEALA